MAKIVRLQITSIVKPLRVVILQIVASAALLHVKIALQHATVQIVRPLLIAVTVLIAVLAPSAAPVTVIRVRHGAVTIEPRRVANMQMQRQRSVVNLRRVLSAATAVCAMSCRFSGQPALTPHLVVHAPSSRMTTGPSAEATSPQALR
jgi:hypothetical protein